MPLPIHEHIKEKLDYFFKNRKIPHIIFHGPSGSGKRTIVHDFIHMIYDNKKEKIKDFVMNVNCAHGKGIKFIREELKFFAKTHINSKSGDLFKSIILSNADKLTMDAQSALRRCIELFSHNTRFFIIVEDKYKLLKPILSRFCEIYVPLPTYKNKEINLYKFNLDETFNLNCYKQKRLEYLKIELNKNMNNKITSKNLMNFVTKLNEKGYSGLDFIELLENPVNFSFITLEKRYELLLAFNLVKKEIRSEKIIIMFILNFLYLSLNNSLENISFM